jgi:hypothetical protein
MMVACLSLLACLATTARSQEKAQPEPGAALAKADPKADAVAEIGTAFRLIEYGRKTKSPEALIAAAGILRRVPAAVPIKADEEADAPKQEKADELPSLRQQAEELLAEAKTMANNDPHVVAVADSVGNRKTTRGLATGPQMAQRALPPNSSTSWTLKLVPGAPVVVAVQGAGNTPLRVVVRYYGGGNDFQVANSEGVVGQASFVAPAFPNGRVHISVRNIGQAPTMFRVAVN